MMKYLKYFLTITTIVIISFGKGYSQDIVKNIKLYVVPFNFRLKRNLYYYEVKDWSTIIIKIKEPLSELENDEFLDLISSLNSESEIKLKKFPDYRIVCIVNKIFGKEVLYFTRSGEFLYKGKTYKNEKIKSFVFSHIPEFCK